MTPFDVQTWLSDQAQLSLTRWVTNSAVWNLGQLTGLLGNSMTPNLDSHWFRQTYGLMVGMAAALAPLFLILGGLQALLRQDPGTVGRAVVNLAVAFVAAALAIPLAVLLMQLTDNLSGYLVGTELDSLNRFFDSVGQSLSQDVGAGGTQNPGVPLFMVFCAGNVICFGCILIWLELLVREAATYVALLFFPLLLAAAIWPKAMQLVRQFTELLLAVILSKFAIVVVIAAGGAAMLDVVERRDLGGLLVGGAILLLAAYAPYRLLRMLPAMEVAAVHVFTGEGRRSLGGLQGGAWHAYSLARDAAGLARTKAAGPAVGGGSLAAGSPAAGAGLAAALAVAAGRKAGDRLTGGEP